MPYAWNTTFPWTTNREGNLAATVVDSAGNALGSQPTADFLELQETQYGLDIPDMPDGHRGWVIIADGALEVAVDSVNPLRDEGSSISSGQIAEIVDDILDGIGGGGVGANEVTLVFENEIAEKVPGVSVTIRNAYGDALIAGPVLSDIDGEIHVNLDSGSYLVLVLSTPNYEPLEAIPLTVDGPEVETYTLIRVVVDAPEDAAVCRVYGWLVRLDGDKAAGVKISFLMPGQGEVNGMEIQTGVAITAKTDSEGYFEADLIRSSAISPESPRKYRVQCTACRIDTTITVPNAATANFADLL